MTTPESSPDRETALLATLRECLELSDQAMTALYNIDGAYEKVNRNVAEHLGYEAKPAEIWARAREAIDAAERQAGVPASSPDREG